MTAEETILRQLTPGTMLTLNSAPEAGYWFVVHCRVETFPGNWHHVNLLLLNRQRLLTVEKESVEFFLRWTIHEL